MSCTYPLEYRAVRAVSLLYAVLCDSFLLPRYGDREFQENELKEHVLTTAYVSFTWAARMDSHVERQQVRVRVDHALGAERRVPLPDGWSVALGALGKLTDAREIPPAEIPPNVTEARCDLVGVPKPVAPAAAVLAPGACVALSHSGVRVNFVLLAHISGSVWFCSTGGRSFGETIVPETAWHNDFCIQ